MIESEADIHKIRQLLLKFQDGYDRKDPDIAEDFMSLCVPDADLEIIGTRGITPGEDDWSLGEEQVLAFFIRDLGAGSSLKLDTADARIHVLGDVAWVTATGTVNLTLPAEQVYTNELKAIQKIVAHQSAGAKERLLEILRGGANTLFEVEHGDSYTWPLRFSAVLVQHQEQWLFHQNSIFLCHNALSRRAYPHKDEHFLKR